VGASGKNKGFWEFRALARATLNSFVRFSFVFEDVKELRTINTLPRTRALVRSVRGRFRPLTINS